MSFLGSKPWNRYHEPGLVRYLGIEFQTVSGVKRAAPEPWGRYRGQVEFRTSLAKSEKEDTAAGTRQGSHQSNIGRKFLRYHGCWPPAVIRSSKVWKRLWVCSAPFGRSRVAASATHRVTGFLHGQQWKRHRCFCHLVPPAGREQVRLHPAIAQSQKEDPSKGTWEAAKSNEWNVPNARKQTQWINCRSPQGSQGRGGSHWSFPKLPIQGETVTDDAQTQKFWHGQCGCQVRWNRGWSRFGCCCYEDPGDLQGQNCTAASEDQTWCHSSHWPSETARAVQKWFAAWDLGRGRPCKGKCSERTWDHTLFIFDFDDFMIFSDWYVFSALFDWQWTLWSPFLLAPLLNKQNHGLEIRIQLKKRVVHIAAHPFLPKSLSWFGWCVLLLF